MSDEVLSGTRMPGTPRGVGEIQAFISKEDGARGSMLEVVAYEPGVRVHSRELRKDLPANVVELRAESEIEPLAEDRCRLTHTHVMVLSVPEDRLSPSAVAKWRTSVTDRHDQQFARLRHILESGEPVPAQATE